MPDGRPIIPPEQLHSKTFPTSDELRELATACAEFDVSDATKLMLAKRASMPPAVRLTVNLKSLLNLMVDGPIYNLLTEGLTSQEHSALVELDVRGLPVNTREVAHGLLNIHERWVVMRMLRSFFKRATKVQGGFLTPEIEAEETLDTGEPSES